jgi:hypothetical protein
MQFSLTANNVSYGATGLTLKYFDFFPAEDSTWGRIPVWGIGEVVVSRHPAFVSLSLPLGLFSHPPLLSHLSKCTNLFFIFVSFPTFLALRNQNCSKNQLSLKATVFNEMLEIFTNKKTKLQFQDWHTNLWLLPHVHLHHLLAGQRGTSPFLSHQQIFFLFSFLHVQFLIIQTTVRIIFRFYYFLLLLLFFCLFVQVPNVSFVDGAPHRSALPVVYNKYLIIPQKVSIYIYISSHCCSIISNVYFFRAAKLSKMCLNNLGMLCID